MEDERYPHIMSPAQKKQKQREERLRKACTRQNDPERWRDLTAFFFLGICNNFGFNVILTAAHDIISMLDQVRDVS